MLNPSMSEHWYRNNAIIKKAKALIKGDDFLVDTVPAYGNPCYNFLCSFSFQCLWRIQFIIYFNIHMSGA